MRVVVHYPALGAPPIGVWWDEGSDEAPGSYYVSDEGPTEVLGREQMSLNTGGVPWEQYWQRLADSTPHPDDYEMADVPDGQTPPEFLHSLLA